MNQVCIDRDPEVPLVHFRWILPGGATGEDRAREGLTNFALESLRRGSPGRDRLATARWLAAVSSHFSVQVAADQAQVTALVPARCLGDFLDRLAVVVRETDPLQEQIDLLRRELVEGFRVGLEHPGIRAALLWRRLLFGADSWGNLATGSPGSLLGLEARDLAKRRQELMGAPGWLALAGDVLLDETEIARRLGRVGIPASLPSLPTFLEAGPRLGLWHDARQEQATFVLGWTGPPLHDRDLIATRLAEKILCSEFTSYLCQDFRQRAGLTYGISGAHQPTCGGSVFVLKTSTGSTLAPQFLEDLLGALRIFAAGSGDYRVRGQGGEVVSRQVVLDETTVASYREKTLKALPFRFHTPQARLGKLLDHVLYDAPPPDREGWAERIAGVTASDLADQVRQLFAGRPWVVAIVDNMERNGQAYRGLADWITVMEGNEATCGLN